MSKNVLVIDDDEFVYANLLKERGVQITQKQDIQHLSDTEPFDIIICDVEGVGKRIGESHGVQMNGALLASMIKAAYPEKKVIIHTGTISERYSDYFRKVDSVYPKGCLDLDYWMILLQ